MRLAKNMKLFVFAKLFPPETNVIIFTKDKRIFDIDDMKNIADHYRYREDLIIDCFDTRSDYMFLRDLMQITLK